MGARGRRGSAPGAQVRLGGCGPRPPAPEPRGERSLRGAGPVRAGIVHPVMKCSYFWDRAQQLFRASKYYRGSEKSLHALEVQR